MTAYEKPSLDIAAVEAVLKKHLGSNVTEVTLLKGGNLSSVFSFAHEGKGYVIKFSDLHGAYETERVIADLLSSQGVPFPQCLGQGKFDTLDYSISERIFGHNLIDCSAEQKRSQLPQLIRILTRMNHVELGETSGYGWIKSNGDGTFHTWKDYITASFAEDQTGTFWEGWHALFQTTCLEKDVFDECYYRLTAYATYNESHRYFIHGDFHPWNILSDGECITGIIDGNFAYGDFLVDLAILAAHMRELNVVEAYEEYQEHAGIHIPDFKERLIGAQYFKGLDGLRFYAKMGWNDAYDELRNELLSLTN
jgi:hygromycin-B 4-O-kinase